MKANNDEKKALKELLMDPNSANDLKVLRQYRVPDNEFKFLSPEKIPPLPDEHVVTKVEIPDKDNLADEILSYTRAARENMREGFDNLKKKQYGISYHVVLRNRAEELADEKIKKYQEINAKIDADVMLRNANLVMQNERGIESSSMNVKNGKPKMAQKIQAAMEIVAELSVLQQPQMNNEQDVPVGWKVAGRKGKGKASKVR